MATQAAPQVTEEQAGEALRALIGQTTEEEPGIPAESEEQPPEPEPEPASAEPAHEGEEQPAAIGEPGTDDIESLKARLTDAEKRIGETEKQYQARLEAVQTRYAQNEQVLRDRYLRKASATDNALKVLRSARSADGVSEADVDRVLRELESTMNPASPSYAPPEAPTAVTEDRAMVMNNFLNERGMTMDEAETFGKWINAEATKVMHPAELAVAATSLDGFLRLAHNRYQAALSDAAKQTKRSDVVGAVRSVQNTQRQALRAGSASPAAPRKQPTGGKQELDVSKMSKDDVSQLLRLSVQQYK